ncbi:MAG TPA: TadE/TadG family type IV pilus assembly protein [Sphingomicrobium sp.]|nr:TadE/TadG family type IV pilus assembly protein [Sphingomicrobium sp.]
MIRRLITCDRGNSFIEMALALPIIIGLLMGMVDISRGVSTKLKLAQAAQRTVENVQRSGFTYSTAAMTALETEAETVAGTGSDATVTAWLECGSSTTKLTYTNGCSGTEPYSRHMNIRITKPFTPIFGTQYFPGANADGTFTVTATAGVRVQ